VLISKVTILASNPTHPNRHAFSGIVTYFDHPSDHPVGGANGRLVVIPSSVGVPALASLEGMAVNVNSSMSGHAPTNKVGVISKAYVGEPLDNGAVPVYVEGYLFAKDFPDVVTDLQAAKDELGFSYECDATVEETDWNGKKALVATSCVFSGATILYKTKAAYARTSFAAEKEGNDLDKFLKMFLKAMAGEDPAAETAESTDDAADDEVTRQAMLKLAEAINFFREFKESFGDGSQYATLSVFLNASAEKDAQIVALTKRVDELSTAQATLTASSATPIEGFVKVEDYDALRAQFDELKTKVESTEVALKAEADAKSAYARKSVAVPRTLMAKYAVSDEDDIVSLRAQINARTDIDSVGKMALIMEAQAKHVAAAK
jgi:hypothetical protein